MIVGVWGGKEGVVLPAMALRLEWARRCGRESGALCAANERYIYPLLSCSFPLLISLNPNKPLYFHLRLMQPPLIFLLFNSSALASAFVHSRKIQAFYHLPALSIFKVIPIWFNLLHSIFWCRKSSIIHTTGCHNIATSVVCAAETPYIIFMCKHHTKHEQYWNSLLFVLEPEQSFFG